MGIHCMGSGTMAANATTMAPTLSRDHGVSIQTWRVRLYSVKLPKNLGGTNRLCEYWDAYLVELPDFDAGLPCYYPGADLGWKGIQFSLCRYAVTL